MKRLVVLLIFALPAVPTLICAQRYANSPLSNMQSTSAMFACGSGLHTASVSYDATASAPSVSFGSTSAPRRSLGGGLPGNPDEPGADGEQGGGLGGGSLPSNPLEPGADTPVGNLPWGMMLLLAGMYSYQQYKKHQKITLQ